MRMIYPQTTLVELPTAHESGVTTGEIFVPPGLPYPKGRTILMISDWIAIVEQAANVLNRKFEVRDGP